MSDKDYLYNVPVDGGKYIFRFDKQGHLDVLRHGEPWWTPTEGSKALLPLMDGEERRQNALRRVDDYVRKLRETEDAADPVLHAYQRTMLTILREVRGELTDDAG